MPRNPEGTLVRGRFRSSGFSHPDDALDQHLMPNFVEAALPAGSGIAFDVSAAAPIESSDLKETAAPVAHLAHEYGEHLRKPSALLLLHLQIQRDVWRRWPVAQM